MKPIYLKKDKEDLIFDGDYMVAYIPEYLFEKGICNINGNIVNMMGLFNFRVGKDYDDASKNRLNTFNYPTIIVSRPSNINKKTLELTEGSGEQNYRLFEYLKGDSIMKLSTLKDVNNTNNFEEMKLDGKLPNTLAYDKILEIELKNNVLNNCLLGVPASIYSAVISEIYRYKKDKSYPFRIPFVKGKCQKNDYTPANARTISAYNSTFSAMTFEDFDTMAIISVNKNKTGGTENYTPIEEIIKA